MRSMLFDWRLLTSLAVNAPERSTERNYWNRKSICPGRWLKMVIVNVLPGVISWRDKWRDIYYRESACNALLIDSTWYSSFPSSSSCSRASSCFLPRFFRSFFSLPVTASDGIKFNVCSRNRVKYRAKDSLLCCSIVIKITYDCLPKVLERLLKLLMNILRVLYKIFWHFLNTVARFDVFMIILVKFGKFKNIHRNYKLLQFSTIILYISR